MALKQFTSDSLKALIELNGELVVEKLQSLGLLEITIDLDGTVVSTKGHPTWALKGYNPIKRGAPSYFPLTAHVAETGHFLTIWNRPGNVHDSNRALDLIKTIQRRLPMFSIRFRADSAFCAPQVINYLLYQQISFAIKAPFWKLLGLEDRLPKSEKSRIPSTTRGAIFWLKSPIHSLEKNIMCSFLGKRSSQLGNTFNWTSFHPIIGFTNTLGW